MAARPAVSGQSLYSYVLNNPVNLIDPLGLQSGFEQMIRDMIRDMTLMAPSQLPRTQVEADQIGQNPLPNQQPLVQLGQARPGVTTGIGGLVVGGTAAPVAAGGLRMLAGGGRSLAAASCAAVSNPAVQQGRLILSRLFLLRVHLRRRCLASLVLRLGKHQR